MPGSPGPCTFGTERSCGSHDLPPPLPLARTAPGDPGRPLSQSGASTELQLPLTGSPGLRPLPRSTKHCVGAAGLDQLRSGAADSSFLSPAHPFIPSLPTARLTWLQMSRQGEAGSAPGPLPSPGRPVSVGATLPLASAAPIIWRHGGSWHGPTISPCSLWGSGTDGGDARLPPALQPGHGAGLRTRQPAACSQLWGAAQQALSAPGSAGQGEGGLLCAGASRGPGLAPHAGWKPWPGASLTPGSQQPWSGAGCAAESGRPSAGPFPRVGCGVGGDAQPVCGWSRSPSALLPAAGGSARLSLPQT